VSFMYFSELEFQPWLVQDGIERILYMIKLLVTSHMKLYIIYHIIYNI
jgi:hypothetical protein